MKISYDQLNDKLKQILLNHGFHEPRAALCASVFAGNSRDGVHSHGANRFPTFIGYVRNGWININAEPEILSYTGGLERWDGNLAPGVYLATRATTRAVELAKQNGIGCVAIRNSNHWMRGGTYGWQAAEAGCIAICGTNSIANMPPFGGTEPRLGNNPLVIAVPRENGHLVLDMAMSQFSYGKLNEYKMQNGQLPVPGGYDSQGNISKDPAAIIESQRTLPIGFWKGSGLSLMIDVLVSILSDGRPVGEITSQQKETGVSQFFICIHPDNVNAQTINSIIDFAKSSSTTDDSSIRYPGEQTLHTRKRSDQDGIEVNDEVWRTIQSL